MTARRAALTLVATAVVTVATLAAGSAALAQDTGWTIESFHVTALVHADGTVTVVEEIAVDFADLQRRGIFRVIPVRYPTDDPNLLRAIHVDRIAVTATAPDDLDITRPGPIGGTDLTLRIGDPDVTVTGRQTYEISYRVRGALNSFDTHEELYWNATGAGWPVPIVEATTSVMGPGGITEATCFRGPPGSPRLCDGVDHRPDAATVRAQELAPGEGLTVVAGFPAGSVAVAPPTYVERWSLRRALVGSPAAVPLTALTALLALGGVGLLAYRQGRDRVTRGGLSVDHRIEDGQDQQRRRLFSPWPVTVRFRPPDGLRPAHLGLVVDERVDPVEVSATIVDLAVRSHLVIEELTTKRLLSSRTDWRLRRTRNLDDELSPFEAQLVGALFGNKDQVDLSELKGEFAEDYAALQGKLYEEGVRRGWFPRNPRTVRTVWLTVGLALTALAVGVLVLAVLFTTVALAAVPLLLAALLLTVGHRWMPHRTPAGSRLLVETLGFREFIRTAETGRMEFAEEEDLFVSYLPFAVVFGAVDKWARAFAHLGAAAAAGVGTWYVTDGRAGDLTRLSSGLSDFSNHVGGTLPTSPASSGSSGFSGGSSGGGFGGGGGGSW